MTEGWRIGGAQAVAALAYGTATIRRVDKIVGPGNIYVALAKRACSARSASTWWPGPSEVVVDRRRRRRPRVDRRRPARPGRARPDGARAADHRRARAAARAWRRRSTRSSSALPRRAIAAEALARATARSILVAISTTRSTLANRLAPEHLELMVARPGGAAAARAARRRDLPGRAHARGRRRLRGRARTTCCPPAAPRASRRRSATEDFVKRSSVIEYSPAGLRGGAAAPGRARRRVEGLDGHGSRPPRCRSRRRRPADERRDDRPAGARRAQDEGDGDRAAARTSTARARPRCRRRSRSSATCSRRGRSTA